MNDRAAESSFFILQTIHVFFFFFGMKFDLKKNKKKTASGTAASQTKQYSNQSKTKWEQISTNLLFL